MNDDLLSVLMADLDPVRNLSDSALEELVPYDHLITRVLSGLQQSAPHAVGAHTPLWRRTSLRISAAAAVVLVASGIAVQWSSSPTGVTAGLALGAVHPSWVAYGANLSPGAIYAPATRSMAATLVSKGRITTVLRLDGMTIAPPPSATVPRSSAPEMARELWASTALQGQTEVAFGYGNVTLHLSQHGVPKLHDVPAWVAIATSKPCVATSACSASEIAALPLTVVVSGYGLANTERTTGVPIAFAYQTGARNSRTQPHLLGAVEQVSVGWLRDGRSTEGRLRIKVAGVPCGALNGYFLTANTQGTMLTIRGLIPESTYGDYCALATVTTRVIALHGRAAGATTISHAPIGPIRATK